MGSAIISLPNVIFSFGYILGPGILAIASIASFWGLVLYLHCASRIGRHSSPASLAEASFPIAGLILDICIILKSLGVSLSYVVIIGSTISIFVSGLLGSSGDNFITDSRFWMVFTGIFVLFPLSLLKTSNKLRFTSGFGVFSAIYLVMLSIYGVWALPGPSHRFFNINWAYPITLSNIGVFGTAVFSFSCHQIIFTLYNETKNNRLSAMSAMCGTVIGSAFTLYLIFSFCSLCSFSDKIGKTPGTLFSWYPTDSIPFQIARCLYAALISFSYPLQVLPYRVSAKRLFNIGEQANERVTRFCLTMFFVAVTVGAGLFQPSFDVVLSLVGSFSSSIICYVLPAVFYLKITNGELNKKKHLRVISYLLGTFGVLVFGVCSFSSISRLSL